MYWFHKERRELWLPLLGRRVRVRRPFPHRVKSGLGAAGQMQPAEDPAHMGAHSRLADHDPVGDFLVAQPLGDQPLHLHLARGKCLGGGLQLFWTRGLLQQLAGDGRMERWLNCLLCVTSAKLFTDPSRQLYKFNDIIIVINQNSGD